MSAHAHRTSWFARLLGLRAVHEPEYDPADMGTAIAMDYLLDQQPTQTPAAGSPPPPGEWRFGAPAQTSSTHQGR
ncbi:MAG: hypothetical protein LCH73_01325 [Proteobacteria bacterium]|nr:hypothetical protein [Pseudomonadota bacterium]